MDWKQVRLTVAIVILSLGLCLPVYAEKPWHKFVYFQNWGGLNDNLSLTEIADNEATTIQNVIFDTGGAIKKRFGFDAIPNDIVQKVATGTTVAITGLAFFEEDGGDRQIVAITNNDSKATAMKKDYGVGGGLESGAWNNIDNIQLPSSYSNNDLPDFAVAEDKLVFTVPAPIQTTPFVYTGGDDKTVKLTIDSDCPVAEVVEYHKNHLFLAGNDSFPSRVYFSALDDITDYTATDFFDVQTSDGSRVRALISAYNSLYIFKDSSIWRLSGAERDTFILEKLVSNIGTLSNQSVAIVNNFIYFVTSQNDIAVYDGAYKVQFISQKIRNTIGGLNFTRAQYALGLPFSTYKYVDHDYYCSVSDAGSGENNTVLLFDTAFSAWTKFKGITANAWVVAEDSLGQNLMIFGDYDGYVHSYPSSSYYDANVATAPTLGFYEVTSSISAFYQTKWFKYSDLALEDKYWRLLKTYALSETDGSTLSVEVKTDYEASGSVLSIDLSESGSLWDVALWDVDFWSGAGLRIERDEINEGKDMFQVRYSNNTVNEGFTILGWELYIEPTVR